MRPHCALTDVLHPHFVRGEEIALPPFGFLVPLLGNELPSDAPEALAMTDSLRAELPRMLEEHKRIGAAVDALRSAARAERAEKYEHTRA